MNVNSRCKTNGACGFVALQDRIKKYALASSGGAGALLAEHMARYEQGGGDSGGGDGDVAVAEPKQLPPPKLGAVIAKPSAAPGTIVEGSPRGRRITDVDGDGIPEVRREDGQNRTDQTRI